MPRMTTRIVRGDMMRMINRGGPRMDAVPAYGGMHFMKLDTRDVGGVSERRQRVMQQALESAGQKPLYDEDEEVQHEEADGEEITARYAKEVERLQFLTRFVDIFNGKNGPEARIKLGGILLRLVCFCQLALLVPVVVFAATGGLETLHEDIIVILLSAVAGAVGFASGQLVSEHLARLYFVIDIWLLFALTELMYTAVENEQQQRETCRFSVADYAIGTDCVNESSYVEAKVTFVYFALFLCALGAYLGYELNDSINDYNAIRPMLRAQEGADVWLNVDYPEYYSREKPKDVHMGQRWHKKYEIMKSAPDIEVKFFNVAGPQDGDDDNSDEKLHPM